MDPGQLEDPVPAGAHETLPARYYTDREIFAEETEKILAGTWHLVGHRSQVAEKGDLIVATVAGRELMIVRGHDGVLRAFFNACIHRGHRLVERGGNRRLITCPYHAWCYDTDGTVRKIPNSDNVPGFDPASLRLRAARLEVFHGLIFVNLDPNAVALAEHHAVTSREIGEHLPALGDCVLAHRTEAVLKANWKIVIENFSECYHCNLVHKAFTDGIVAPDSYRIVARGMSQHHRARSQPSDRQSYAWKANGGKKTDTFAAWYLWPLTAVQAYPGGIGMTFRWIPVGPDETKVEADWWLESAEPRPFERDLIDQHARTTFPEDIPLLESVQRSMRSRTFDRGFVLVDRDRSQASEHGVKAFNDLYLRHMSGPDA